MFCQKCQFQACEPNLAMCIFSLWCPLTARLANSTSAPRSPACHVLMMIMPASLTMLSHAFLVPVNHPGRCKQSKLCPPPLKDLAIAYSLLHRLHCLCIG